jgi:NitT/TauT family transport system permease protein
MIAMLRRVAHLRYALVTTIVLLVIWEGSVRILKVPVYLLPPPSLIATELLSRWDRVAAHLWVTTSVMIIGYCIAVLIALPLAVGLSFSPRFEASVYPLIVFLQILPKIAIAPLFVIWFGFGVLPKVLLVFLLSFFPIVVSGVAGFRSIDPEILELSRSTGASAWLTFRLIRLPQALPQIFTGLKVAAALSATAVIVAEFVASDRGLGYLLLVYNGELKTPMVFATIIVLGIIGMVVYYLVELAQRLVIPWHVSMNREAAGTTPV